MSYPEGMADEKEIARAQAYVQRCREQLRSAEQTLAVTVGAFTPVEEFARRLWVLVENQKEPEDRDEADWLEELADKATRDEIWTSSGALTEDERAKFRMLAAELWEEVRHAVMYPNLLDDDDRDEPVAARWRIKPSDKWRYSSNTTWFTPDRHDCEVQWLYEGRPA